MVKVNGEELTAGSGMSVAELLKAEGYDCGKIAVEYNGEILPKSSYGSTFLKNGDVLEVVSFVGGG